MNKSAQGINGSRVSVIIPCYNAAQFLTETIESVLAQTYSNYEIIAVDDGSTDDTATVLASYADRITILYHGNRQNRGQAASTNLGLSHADSEYIAFIDSDDIWMPEKLQKQVEILETHQDVGLVYTNGYVIDGVGKKCYSLFDIAHHENNGIGDILLNCYIRTPSLVLVRKSLIDAAGPFPANIVPGDHYLWVKISEISRFYFLDEKLTCYREHQGQLSLTANKKMWEDSLWVLENAIQRYPYPKIIKNKRFAVIHYRLGLFNMKINAYPSALAHFLKSLWYDPNRAFKKIIGIG